MFSIVMKQQRSPADAWAKAHRIAERKDEYLTWHRGLPTGWLNDFAVQGLRPFLSTRGFDVPMSEKELVKWIAEWAFTHVWITNHPRVKYPRTFLKWLNNGDDQEFDWFCLKISTDDWMAFADQWKSDEFLDESDAGMKQRYDLMLLAWHLVSLTTSKAYDDYLAITQDTGVTGYGEDDNQVLAPTSEDTAFGGDRRTH
jgi:hypothetical protein